MDLKLCGVSNLKLTFDIRRNYLRMNNHFQFVLGECKNKQSLQKSESNDKQIRLPRIAYKFTKVETFTTMSNDYNE